MAFTLPPRLANAHVALRPLLPADREALFLVAADPLIWAQHPAHDRWQAPVFAEFFDAAIASGGALLALDPTTGAAIGSSRLDKARAGTNEIEIGWTFLACSHWGSLVNPSMKALMLALALQSFERVVFLIGETNIRSRRAIEKIGAVLTPRTDPAFLGGKHIIHVVYAIDRAAFASGPIAHLA
jgi:RimJ/RimL family protein N-acetyltransferase